MAQIDAFFKLMNEQGASDLHMVAGQQPLLRVRGDIERVKFAALKNDPLKAMLYEIIPEDKIKIFEETGDIDFGYEIPGLARYRGNLFQQKYGIGSVFREIPSKIMTCQELNLPKVISKLATLPKGLVLVTGATGSGKSTTLAAMIDHINNTRNDHVVTVEDPIEFVHRNKKCLFNQREVGTDTQSFAAALRSVLRQDPDIVLIGEMRDQETIEAALRISETGHLTFGTLHTSDCVQTINRIIDVFPSYQQPQIRTQLSFVLESVFCQQLLSRSDGRGRVLAAEIMVCNSAVRSLVRDDKAHQIYSIIQTSGKLGMRTMNQSLFELYRAGLITYEEALAHTSDPEDLKRVFQRTL